MAVAVLYEKQTLKYVELVVCSLMKWFVSAILIKFEERTTGDARVHLLGDTLQGCTAARFLIISFPLLTKLVSIFLIINLEHCGATNVAVKLRKEYKTGQKVTNRKTSLLNVVNKITHR